MRYIRHELKTDPEAFDAVASGLKNFEIRFDDRGFQVGDTLILQRTRHSRLEMQNGSLLEYTGQIERRVVTYILRGPIYGLQTGWVIMALGPANCAPRSGWQPLRCRFTHYFAAGAATSLCKASDYTPGADITDHSGPVPCHHCMQLLVKF
jgi:hypothetical protein